MRKGVRRIITWASLVAGIFTVFDLGLYFWRFAPGHWWTLAQDSEEWGRFGEFVGGTLGPLFALLAFGAALFAISEQHQQASIDELQRLMFSMYEGINRLLNSNTPQLDTIAAQQFRDEDTFGKVLHSIYARTIGSSPDAKPLVQLAVDVAAACIRHEAGVMETELIHLLSLLREYERQGGSDAVISFYRDRYREVVCSLHFANLLESSWVREFFDPIQCIKIAREVAAREQSEEVAHVDSTG